MNIPAINDDNNNDAQSELIHLIYNSIADPRGWEIFTERLMEYLDADFCHSLITDFESPSHNHGLKLNSATGQLIQYHGKIYQEDNFLKVLMQLKDKQVFLSKDFFYQSEKLFSDKNGAFCTDFRCDNFIITHIKTRQKPAHYMTYLFGRDSKKNRFDNDHKTMLETLTRHMDTAYALSVTMNHLTDMNNFILKTLDHIPTGVVITSSRGSIIHKNKIAESYLNNGEFTLDGNLLTLNDADANMALQKIINEANQNAHGQYISLSKPTGGRMYLYCIPQLLSPGANHSEWRLSDGAQNVIFITDDARHIALPLDILKSLYNLTNSESRVTQLLVNGQSTEDIAKILDINVNSVRFHLKNCFQKAQVTNQAELVGRILRSLGNLPLYNE
jgi:DNA-binding CsgD family transcriptional regulator